MYFVFTPGVRKASLDCTKCGWFSAGWHELSGSIYDENEKVAFTVDGKWNETLYATRKQTAPAGVSFLQLSDVLYVNPSLAKKAVEKGRPKHKYPLKGIPFNFSWEDVPEGLYQTESKEPFWTNVELVCKEAPWTQWKMTQV